MADVELVIKIPEEVYKHAKEIHEVMCDSVWLGIKNSTPLPKGHGRLLILSEDAVKRELTHLGFSCQSWISDVGLSDATVAIIEADNGDGNTWYDIPADEMSESQLRVAVKELRKKLAEVMNNAYRNYGSNESEKDYCRINGSCTSLE